MNDQLFTMIMNDLKDIKIKVNELIAFKYYFIGAAAAVSSVVSVTIGILMKFVGKS